MSEDSPVTFQPLFQPSDLTGQTAPQMAAPEEVFSRLNPNLPSEFVESCHQTAGYISQLDADPDAAIQRPEIRTFVQELAPTGFVGGVHVSHRMGGADPRQALPAWLQPDFLSAHDLSPAAGITEPERNEIDQLFGAASAAIPYEDHQHGRYFALGGGDQDTALTQRFKYYVESKNLLSLLRGNQLDGIIDALGEQNVRPESMKLFESERLVFYFDNPASTTGSRVRDIFLAHGIEGRGPAQDVSQVIFNGETLEVRARSSNDGALGDGGHNPVQYTAPTYNPNSFMESYFDLCLYAGKDPAEPYRTSFVYLFTPDDRPIDPAFVEQASKLVDYPIVTSSSRRGVPLTV